MDTLEQPQERQHVCRGDTDTPERLEQIRLSQPWVFVLNEREYVIELNGVFTKYRDGEALPADERPKG